MGEGRELTSQRTRAGVAVQASIWGTLDTKDRKLRTSQASAVRGASFPLVDRWLSGRESTMVSTIQYPDRVFSFAAHTDISPGPQ